LARHARPPLQCPIIRDLVIGSAAQNENIFRMDGIGTGEAAKVAQYTRAAEATQTEIAKE
jgi:hypothetical protein